MQVDDLFTKIGVLTMEVEFLRLELKKASERADEAESKLAELGGRLDPPVEVEEAKSASKG